MLCAGTNNPNITYALMRYKLSKTNQEENLGVIVDSSIKVSTQFGAAA